MFWSAGCCKFFSSKPWIRIGIQPRMWDPDPYPYQMNTYSQPLFPCGAPRSSTVARRQPRHLGQRLVKVQKAGQRAGCAHEEPLEGCLHGGLVVREAQPQRREQRVLLQPGRQFPLILNMLLLVQDPSPELGWFHLHLPVEVFAEHKHRKSFQPLKAKAKVVIARLRKRILPEPF